MVENNNSLSKETKGTMTDKELIKAEIESRLKRLTDGCVGQRYAYQNLLEFIDSIPEEPISNPTPNERMSKERFAEACKAACNDINYRSHYGHTETRDDYFVDGVQWADEHPFKELVTEDLEKETKKWWKERLHLNPENQLWMDAHQSIVFAKHFFELGMRVNNPITATDRGTAEEIIINLKRVESDYRIDLTKEITWVRNKVQKGEQQ